MVVVPALLVALIAALAATAAAAPTAETIAFVNDGGLHVVAADGTGLSLLRRSGCGPDVAPPCPTARTLSWSPDGHRLAAVFGGALYVFDRRDGSEHLLQTGVEVSGKSAPAWSPDGRKLAFLDLETQDGGTTFSDVFVADVDGGTVRKLTSEGEVADLAWAPGQQIVFSSAEGDRFELFVLDGDGGDRLRVTQSPAGVVNRWPSWSPAGTEIAFVRVPKNGFGHLHVVRGDGTRLRQLSTATVDVAFGQPPSWSPDGSKIVFSTSRNGRPSPITRVILGRDLYVVGADGTGETRLTQSAERHAVDRAPSWSPDGSVLAFEGFDRDGRSRSSVYVANADGTCEIPIAGVEGWRPGWRPLTGVAPAARACSDLTLVVKRPRVAGTAGRFLVTVLNDGTTPLTNIRLGSDGLRATVLAATSPDASCSVSRGRLGCRVARLAVGEHVEVLVRVEGRVITRADGELLGAELAFSVRAAEGETDVFNNRLLHELPTRRCRVDTDGAGEIRGTAFDDTICGRRGRDRIEGGLGRDVVRAGAGDDLVDVRDGDADVVGCGPGGDAVVADAADRVAGDCERVRRPGG